jgi:hypothetical protein
MLSNHWILFHSLSKGDILKISASPWIICRGVLMLKIWKLGFNPYMESFSKHFVWMFLPEFPVELWVTQMFVDLENIVGSFMYFDEKTLCWNNKRIAWYWCNLIQKRVFRSI